MKRHERIEELYFEIKRLLSRDTRFLDFNVKNYINLNGLSEAIQSIGEKREEVATIRVLLKELEHCGVLVVDKDKQDYAYYGHFIEVSDTGINLNFHRYCEYETEKERAIKHVPIKTNKPLEGEELLTLQVRRWYELNWKEKLSFIINAYDKELEAAEERMKFLLEEV